MNESNRRASFGESHLATSKFLTSPAICVGSALGSKRVMRVMPDFPAMMFVHDSAMPIPTGDTMPRPVTTNLRLANLILGSEPAVLLEVCFYVINCLLNRRDLFSFFVRDFALEFFFERHYQFHRIERIRTQIVYK